MTRVICTVGYPGSGKTAAQEPARELGIPVVEMGDIVRERASKAFETGKHDIEYNTRSDFVGKWATKQRDQHGDEVVSEWTVKHIRENVNSKTVFIDGLRSVDELYVLREEFDDVLVIHVVADEETRLERLQSRGRGGEESFTLADLRERDEREDSWGVSRVLDEADKKIRNEDDLGTFHDSIRELLLEWM